MKYSKELHERVRQNLRMFDYPRFDDGDIDALLDEIERLQNENTFLSAEVRDYDALRDERRWMPLPEPPEDKQ